MPPKFGLVDAEDSNYGLKRKRDKEEVELDKEKEREESDERRKRKKSRKTPEEDLIQAQQQEDQASDHQTNPQGKPQGPITNFFIFTKSNSNSGKFTGKTNYFSSENTQQSSTANYQQLEGSDGSQGRSDRSPRVDKRSVKEPNHQ